MTKYSEWLIQVLGEGQIFTYLPMFGHTVRPSLDGSCRIALGGVTSTLNALSQCHKKHDKKCTFLQVLTTVHCTLYRLGLVIKPEINTTDT